MSINICVIGCGALGSVFAAHLGSLRDVAVFAYDLRQEHILAINKDGLQITGVTKITANVRATSNSGDIPHCDFGIIATKSIHTQTAIEETARVFSSSSAVVSVQNGLGNEEILANHVKHVIRGATSMGAQLLAPGLVRFEVKGDVWIGPFEPSNTPYELVKEFASILKRSGLRSVPLRDARGAQWSKLIFNSAVNPVGALTGLHHGAATRFGPTGDLYRSLIAEGESVAMALGIQPYANVWDMVEEGANSLERHDVSMLQDIRHRRQTEIDFLNVAIVEWGKRANVPTPLNSAVVKIVKGLEHSWTDPT